MFRENCTLQLYMCLLWAAPMAVVHLGEQVDRPFGGGEYTCRVPGGFKLQRGRMLPFPQAQAAPIMVVSPCMTPAHS